jgi:hypothetical protein
VTDFKFDTATQTATWTLSEPIVADRMRIALSAPLADLVGNRMPGDSLDLRLDVRPGVVDAAAAGRRAVLARILRGDASALYDLDNSGAVNLVDAVLVRSAADVPLPVGTPGPAPSASGLLQTGLLQTGRRSTTSFTDSSSSSDSSTDRSTDASAAGASGRTVRPRARRTTYRAATDQAIVQFTSVETADSPLRRLLRVARTAHAEPDAADSLFGHGRQ